MGTQYKKEPVLTRPSRICIEVLSKDDTLSSLQERINDYRAFGVANIWVLDPIKRRAYVCNLGDFREVPSVLEVQDSPHPHSAWRAFRLSGLTSRAPSPEEFLQNFPSLSGH